MNLDGIKKKINTYLRKEKSWPVIVDFSAKKELTDFIEYFNIGDNKILYAEKFCREDGTIKIEELINTIIENEGNTFVVGLTAFLKLQGECELRKKLKTILSESIKGHVVVVTYQCKNYLDFSDPRFSERNQIIFADKEIDEISRIIFVSTSIKEVYPDSYLGFNKIGVAYENSQKKDIYIATDISPDKFKHSLINIYKLSDGYDILCQKDSYTQNISKTMGTGAQWNFALNKMGANGSWATIATDWFGSINNIYSNICNFNSFDDNHKWLYFVLISILGVENKYLNLAIKNTTNYQNLVESVFRMILNFKHTNYDFKQLYYDRKEILKDFINNIDPFVDYCKVVSVKEQDAIYYLTDLTKIEKERIIEWLDRYGEEYTYEELAEILKDIYPDLASYLVHFRFKNEFLDNYFEEYKYQKVINKLLPGFKSIVDEQSIDKYFTNITPRSVIVDKLDLKNAQAYFFDALGVEYLGYIQDKCNKYDLSVNINYGQCELPSLTCFNKDFVETCESRGCQVSDIKELDEIKHHGENNFDYEKVKLPIYIIKELEIIDDLLKKIKANISNGTYEKAVIISDHGASRLVVLNESENMWNMATKGVHSGRCCPQNDIDCKPDNAILDHNFWILANYDRFRGSRRANVEVHGGATLEEVTVPIIEITKKNTNIEAFVEDEFKIVSLGAKEHPIIKLYVGVNSDNIVARINEHFYDAEKVEDYIYSIAFNDCVKKGPYIFDLFDGAQEIASGLRFEVKKKGLSEISLFD